MADGDRKTITAPNTKVIVGNNIEVLRGMDSESVDLVVTSPPYWALRDYKSPPQIYGGVPSCVHDWEGCISQPHWESMLDPDSEDIGEGADNEDDPATSQFCTKCGAWRGQLGLEPSPVQYVEHLVSIFDEVKRVLKPTGSCWVNLGDTYATVSGNGFQDDKSTEKQAEALLTANEIRKKLDRTKFRPKSLTQVPSRFAIAMTDHGWILRNEVIWRKPNVMPTSVKDRFTVDFEKFFFFTKNEKYYFDQQFEPLKEGSVARAKRAKYNTRGTNRFDMQHDDPNWQRFANPNGRNMRAVWNIPTKGEHYAHVAMFPKELIDTPIRACCPPGGIVMDIFAGSGTVMSYCKENGIDSIGIEVDPEYEKIIHKRVGKSPFIPKLEDF